MKGRIGEINQVNCFAAAMFELGIGSGFPTSIPNDSREADSPRDGRKLIHVQITSNDEVSRISRGNLFLEHIG
jgi:hypothetical protein